MARGSLRLPGWRPLETDGAFELEQRSREC